MEPRTTRNHSRSRPETLKNANCFTFSTPRTPKNPLIRNECWEIVVVVVVVVVVAVVVVVVAAVVVVAVVICFVPYIHLHHKMVGSVIVPCISLPQNRSSNYLQATQRQRPNYPNITG